LLYFVYLDDWWTTAGVYYLDGFGFSTNDRDNDGISGSCALTDIGGWWYNECAKGKFTGGWEPYPAGEENKGIRWGSDYYLTYVTMLIKVA
jgi:hypothetical protein